jgi:hypothetical protein
MFNFDDINNPRNLDNKVPEGMTDETEFAIIMQSILNILRNAEYEESVGRERLSMQVLNIACDEYGELEDDRVVSVILSLLQHIVYLINSFKELEDIEIDRYFEYFQNSVITPLFKNPNIPYYKED